MSVQSCLNRLNDIDHVVYDSYKCVLNESYKFDTKVDVMCKYERDLDVVYELCGLHESYDYDYINEYNDLMDSINEYNTEYIQEGFGQKVKDFFKKVLEILKKFFSFIGRMLKALFDKLFRRKAKKTADQVASEIISMKQVKEYMEADNSGSEVVHFPAGEGSVIKECDIEVIVKDLYITIENDNYVIGKAPGFEGRTFDNMPSDAHVLSRMKEVKDPEYPLNMFISFIDNINDYQDLINKYIDWFIQYENMMQFSEDTLDDMTYVSDQLNRISDAHGNINKPYKVNQKLILHSQKVINDLAVKMNKVNTVPEGRDKRYVKLLNELVDTVTAVTIGCNQFSRNIGSMYIVDKKYIHSISDIETLGKFVNAMIKANIPSIQVAYNTWIVMDTKFDDRGFFVHEDVANKKISPRWGQTRVVFYPIKEINEVIKIALNATGILANKREQQIFNQYKKHGLQDFLAEPISNYADYAIIIMEKLVMDKERAKNEIGWITDALKNKINENLHHINDIHTDNIGYVPGDDKDWKVVDYAG